MDLSETIRGLIAQKERLEKVLELLQDLQRDYRAGLQFAHPTKAGRKFMPPQEREEVSRRMKKYWAQRRREKTG